MGASESPQARTARRSQARAARGRGFEREDSKRPETAAWDRDKGRRRVPDMHRWEQRSRISACLMCIVMPLGESAWHDMTLGPRVRALDAAGGASRPPTPRTRRWRDLHKAQIDNFLQSRTVSAMSRRAKRAVQKR